MLIKQGKLRQCGFNLMEIKFVQLVIYGKYRNFSSWKLLCVGG